MEGQQSEHEEETRQADAARPSVQHSALADRRRLRDAVPRAVDARRACRPSIRWCQLENEPDAARARRPVFVVFNPHSGKGRGAQLVEPVLRRAAQDGGRQVEHGAHAEAPATRQRWHARRVRRGFRTHRGGGRRRHLEQRRATPDPAPGTEVAPGPRPRRHGLRPRAKSLGIPRRTSPRAPRILRAGHTRPIDVGRVEDRYFLNIVGFGFDIAVHRGLVDACLARRRAALPLLRGAAARPLPGFPVEHATADGAAARTGATLLMLIVANARVFGGGFRIAPAGRPRGRPARRRRVRRRAVFRAVGADAPAAARHARRQPRGLGRARPVVPASPSRRRRLTRPTGNGSAPRAPNSLSPPCRARCACWRLRAAERAARPCP